MSEIEDYPPRPEPDAAPEQAYLAREIETIERDLGRAAARLDVPTPATEPLLVLARARELASELSRQVRVRPIEEAIAARLAWLDRVDERRREETDEPRPQLPSTDLDRRVLQDLLAGWHARRK